MNMQQFIGTKIINAERMNRQQYNDLRGWTVPADENPEDEGYLVEYVDGGKSNVPGYDGYVSWSPKDVFERAYVPTTAMTFSLALVVLLQGKQVARAGWNGKGMYLKFISANNYQLTQSVRLLPWVGLKTADDGFVPWQPSQTDLLAYDWTVV